MRHAAPSSALDHSARCRWFVSGLLAVFAVAGCGREHETKVTSVSGPPSVQVMRPRTRNIVRIVGQPSFVEAYERTSIYPKLTAYIEKWYVDIGDKVTKGQVLADLFVPETVEDFGTKKATVELDKKRIEFALALVEVADANVQAAEAQLAEAKAILDKFEAEVVRWDSEVKRLKREVDKGVVDPQVLLESQNQWRASIASRAAASATIMKAEAQLLSDKATLAKANVDVAVARADLAVAESEARRLEAWVGYLKLYAPFDGMIVARNANTGDFVLPAMGDPTADQRVPYLSPGNNAAPVYVVDRTDVVRIFVDIPEHDANFVHAGTKATVLAEAFRDQPIVGSVIRTSWALNVVSRTLRAEIDLPNTGNKIPDDVPKSTRDALAEVELPDTDSQILPGMYAYGKVIIERPQVLALPVSALVPSGEKTFCWTYEDGKAVKTEIKTGVSDAKWIEVIGRRHKDKDNRQASTDSTESQDLRSSSDHIAWAPFDGSEKVILGDLSILTDGARVRLNSATQETDEKEMARAEPDGAAKKTEKTVRKTTKKHD